MTSGEVGLAARITAAANAEAARVAAAAESARLAAVAEAARKAEEQRELLNILSLIPELGSISRNIGDLAVNNMTKCVKGKLVKRVKLGAKCPKGYVKRK